MRTINSRRKLRVTTLMKTSKSFASFFALAASLWPPFPQHEKRAPLSPLRTPQPPQCYRGRPTPVSALPALFQQRLVRKKIFYGTRTTRTIIGGQGNETYPKGNCNERKRAPSSR